MTGPIFQKEPDLSSDNTGKVTRKRGNYVMLENSPKKINALIGSRFWSVPVEELSAISIT